jgi:hypothetical protein
MFPLVIFANPERPAWVEKVGDYCEKQFFCAVGEGENKIQASASARLELAKIFKVGIKSGQSFLTFGKQEKHQGVVKEMQLKNIQEDVETLVEGIDIAATFEENGRVFALAKMNRTLAAQRLQAEIDKFDEEMQQLKGQSSRKKRFEFLSKWEKREMVADRVEFLAEIRPPMKISRQIFLEERKKFYDQLGVVFLMFPKGENPPSSIDEFLKREMLDFGLQIRPTEKNTDYLIKGQWKQTKKHLKVEGFEKWELSFTLTSFKVGTTAEKGKILFSEIRIGRNIEQILEEIDPKLKEYIHERIGDLNLD